MALQTLEDCVEQFRDEGDWLLAQAVELLAARRGHAVVTGDLTHNLDN